MTAARKRWNRYPAVTDLRNEIVQLLQSLGGIGTHQEILTTILASRSSDLGEPDRRRMASVALRAAVETEKGADEPRFDEYRSGRHILIALHPDLQGYAQRLGQQADKLADENPLPATSRVIEVLRSVSFPICRLNSPHRRITAFCNSLRLPPTTRHSPASWKSTRAAFRLSASSRARRGVR